MDDFVHEENLRRFADALARESDPARRYALLDLLAEEGGKFRTCAERIANAEYQIARGMENIAQQERHITELTRAGHDPSDAVKVLVYMKRTNLMFYATKRVAELKASRR